MSQYRPIKCLEYRLRVLVKDASKKKVAKEAFMKYAKKLFDVQRLIVEDFKTNEPSVLGKRKSAETMQKKF